MSKACTRCDGTGLEPAKCKSCDVCHRPGTVCPQKSKKRSGQFQWKGNAQYRKTRATLILLLHLDGRTLKQCGAVIGRTTETARKLCAFAERSIRRTLPDYRAHRSPHIQRLMDAGAAPDYEWALAMLLLPQEDWERAYRSGALSQFDKERTRA